MQEAAERQQFNSWMLHQLHNIPVEKSRTTIGQYMYDMICSKTQHADKASKISGMIRLEDLRTASIQTEQKCKRHAQAGAWFQESSFCAFTQKRSSEHVNDSCTGRTSAIVTVVTKASAVCIQGCKACATGTLGKTRSFTRPLIRRGTCAYSTASVQHPARK